MQSIGLPRLALHKINRLLYTFLWQKWFNIRRAFEQVKRKVLEAEYSKGGLNMINITEFQNRLYLPWAGKLFDAGKEKLEYNPTVPSKSKL